MNTEGKGRIGRGFALAKASWGVLRADKSLAAFPVIGIVAGGLAAALLFAPGVALFAANDTQEWPLIVFGVLAVYGLSFVTIFCSVALAACASASLDGQDTTVSQGLAVARSRIGVISGWTFISVTLGLILNAIQSALNNQGGGAAVAGAIIGALGSLAWAVATFFVIPIIALEGIGPVDSIKKSVSVIKERWGEGVVGSGFLGIVALPAVIVGMLIGFAGFSVFQTQEGLGIALIAIAVLIIFAASFVVSVLTAIFRVVLYRYATDGAVAGGFTERELDSAFRQNKKKGR
jgi:hypothetical protein